MSSGEQRIAGAFEAARADDRAALIPYLMSGLPDSDSFVDVAVAIAEAGADVIEIGLPFSDPLADGPVIQQAGTAALAAGIDTARSLELVAAVARRTTVPLVVMGYANPLLRHGLQRFCGELADAGGCGMIVADMPPEEAHELRAAAADAGLALTFLVAPTTPAPRLAQVAQLASGFLYCVSLTGVTGARSELSDQLPQFLQRVRDASPLPVAVGFGISSADQVRELAPHADGVVVGSALVARLAAAPPAQAASVAAQFVGELAAATARVSSPA